MLGDRGLGGWKGVQNWFNRFCLQLLGCGQNEWPLGHGETGEGGKRL